MAIGLLKQDCRPNTTPTTARHTTSTMDTRLVNAAPSESVPTSRQIETDWLLPTKLAAPSPRSQLTPRPRLQARLEAGLQRPLTVVAAPAGFGKTTLLAAWRATPAGAAHSLAWVSLDAGDNDPARFWGYVVAALQTVHADLGDGVAVALRSPGASSETVAAAIVRDLVSLQDDLVLVLDDYDAIDAEPIHRGVAFLLEHMPPRLHLVILSRAEPPLPLARLRARGHLLEIGADPLRFDPEESAVFLTETMGRELPDHVTDALVAATEGWAAGLQLAALALDGQGEPSDVVACFTGGHRYVLDYMIEEVLQRQPEQVQQFLLRTSILGRLSGELCDAVTGRHDGRPMLEQLERASLFLVPLDAERGWYRYHLLFGEALRHRLRTVDPASAAMLHGRAAAWLDRNGFASEAVEHSLAACDWPEAMRLMEPLLIRLYERGERATLGQWLAALPVNVLEGNARFTLFRAWTHFPAGQFDAAEHFGLMASARAEESGDTIARARASQFQSHLAAARGDGAAAVEHGRRALVLLPVEDGSHRGWTLYGLGLGHLLLGDLNEAERHLDQASASGSAAGQGLLGGGVELSHVGLIRALQGDLVQAERLYRDVLRRSGEAILTSRSVSLIRLGDLLREQNNLDGAAELLGSGIPLAQQCGGLYSHDGYIVLARVHVARGELNAAWEALSQAEAAAGRLSHSTGARRARAFAVRLRLTVGDLLAGMRWSVGLGLTDADLLRYGHEVEALTLVRLWTVQGRPDRALDLLDRLRPQAEAAGRVASVVEMLALEALADATLQSDDLALTRLAQAAALAEPAGYARLFVDEGAPMARLFEALAAARRRGILECASPSMRYLQQLLASFSGRAVEPVVAVPAAVPGAAIRSWALLEPLSARERDVLSLMATGAGNQQIADRLVVAVTTVKTHVNGIFRKLDAANRIEAVTRARELGLLSQAGGAIAATAISA